MAYSMDLRQRVIDDCDAGLGTKAVAQKYRVSPAWVRRLKQHRRDRGDIRPRVGTGRRATIDDAQLARRVEKVPQGHWNTTTLVAALGHDGMRCGMTLDGAVDGDHFVTFCRDILAPTLSCGDIVVMDNLSSHKVKGAREALESAGVQVCCTCRLTRQT